MIAALPAHNFHSQADTSPCALYSSVKWGACVRFCDVTSVSLCVCGAQGEVCMCSEWKWSSAGWDEPAAHSQITTVKWKRVHLCVSSNLFDFTHNAAKGALCVAAGLPLRKPCLFVEIICTKWQRLEWGESLYCVVEWRIFTELVGS